MSGFTPGNQLPKALQEVTGNGYQEKMQWKYRKIFQLKILVQGFTPTFLVQKVETFPPTRSPHSKRSFGERVFSTFLEKIIAAIFYFYSSGRLGREKNLYQGGVNVGKRKGERRAWGWVFSPLPVPHSHCSSNFKSIMAGRTKNRGLITLTALIRRLCCSRVLKTTSQFFHSYKFSLQIFQVSCYLCRL